MLPTTGFSYNPDLRHTSKVSLTQSSNGETNVLCNGLTLYSRFSPSDSAERLSRKVPLIENCIYIIPSPLLGYGMLSFINRIPVSSTVIGLETDQNLMALTNDHQSEILLRTPGNNYKCFRADSSRQLYEIFRTVQNGLFRTCCLVPLNAGYRQNKEIYDGLFSTLQHFMRNYWQNRLTLAKMAPLWIRNLVENLSTLNRRDISEFHTDKPVLLTGAGESLEATIPLIREFRDQVYVLSVDTAVQSLIRNEIVPDGIVNLEAQFYNLQDFYSIGKRKIDLFSDITAYPPTLRPDTFNHYIFTSTFENTSLHKRLTGAGLMPTEIPPLGSVGVTALYLAGEITEREIFLTGLDFSYTQGKTHARETPFHDYCRLREDRLSGDFWYSFSAGRSSYPAAGKTSGTVTNAILESYGRQLADLCRTMGAKVFDLAAMGLDLSIPRIDRGGLISMLGSSKMVSDNDNEKEKDQTLRFVSENDVVRFRTEEKNRLELLINSWDQIVSEKIEAGEILPLLQSCSHLYFHFPDRRELPNTDPAFLFRVIREARVLLRKLS